MLRLSSQPSVLARPEGCQHKNLGLGQIDDKRLNKTVYSIIYK
jgi:hypothetical protein